MRTNREKHRDTTCLKLRYLQTMQYSHRHYLLRLSCGGSQRTVVVVNIPWFDIKYVPLLITNTFFYAFPFPLMVH